MWLVNAFIIGMVLAWFFGAIANFFGSLAPPSQNTTARRNKDIPLEPYETPEFEEHWETLRTYDERFDEAVEKVAAYGQVAELELKRAFYHINDRKQINKIADRIIRAIESGKIDIEALERELTDHWTDGNSEFERDGDIIIERFGSQEFYWKDGVRYISYDQALRA